MAFQATDANILDAVKRYVTASNRGGLPPIGTWNTSAVTTLRLVASGLHNFNENINGWDVSNVTDMTAAFSNCKSFNQPLDSWDVSKVTSMAAMFLHAESFNQPIGNWNVSGVATMERMFDYAKAFDQPLDDWDVSNVRDFRFMFVCCDDMRQNFSRWNIRPDAEVNHMFISCEYMRRRLFPPAFVEFERRQNERREEEAIQRAIRPPHESEEDAQLRETQRREQLATQVEVQNRVKRMADQIEADQDVSPYEDCLICGNPLDNVHGPSAADNPPGVPFRCSYRCKDVVLVCKNRHKLHRACVLNACRAEGVDVVAQMGFGESGYTVNQARAGKCPICQLPLLHPCNQYNTVNVRAVPANELPLKEGTAAPAPPAEEPARRMVKRRKTGGGTRRGCRRGRRPKRRRGTRRR